MKTPNHSSASIPAKAGGPLRITAIHVSLFLSLTIWSAQMLAGQPEATVTQLWVQHYSETTSNAADSARIVTVDAAGDVIVTGQTDNGLNGQDRVTIKYSGSNGATVWSARYDGFGGIDVALYVALDRHGNVVVTGHSFKPGTYGIYTAKYAATDGALLWSQRYDRPPASGGVRPLAVAIDADDSAIVTALSSSPKPEWYTAKYASDGALIWENHYTGFNPYGGSAAKPLLLDSTGDILLVNPAASLGFHKIVKLSKVDGTVLSEQQFAVDSLLTSSTVSAGPANDLII